MGNFDIKRYKSEVLKPHSKGEQFEQIREVVQALGRSDNDQSYMRLDLQRLYAVPSPATNAELEAWRPTIRSALNKSAGMFAVAKLLNSLLEYLEARGHDLTDPAFWGSLQGQRQKQKIVALQKSLEQLVDEYPLKVTTLVELKSRLDTTGVSGVNDENILAEASNAGLSIYPEIKLPASALPSPGLINSWKNLEKDSSYESVLSVILLHDPKRIKNVSLFDRLSSNGQIIGLQDVNYAHAKADKSKDTNDIQHAKKFLNVLKNEVKDEDTLREIVLTTLTQWVMVRLDRRLPIVMVRDQLVTNGIALNDASRLVSTLHQASPLGSSGPALDLNHVRELLSQGELAEAERAYGAVSVETEEQAEYQQVGALIGKINSEKGSFLERYQDAMNNRDFGVADQALAKAISVDVGDETLLQLRDAIPPLAPSELRVRNIDTAVELTWLASLTPGVGYTVVRSTTGVPRSTNNGTILARNLRATDFVDNEPQVGHEVGYSVFATRDGESFSDASSAKITALQIPQELSAQVRPDNIHLSWTAHPKAAGVIVTRTDSNGTSVETEITSGTTFYVEGLEIGKSYRFLVRAIYLLGSGRQLSAPSTITVVTRGEARAVVDLHIEKVDEEGNLQAIWSEVDGFDVELWSLSRHAELSIGSLLDPNELRSISSERLPVTFQSLGNGKSSAFLSVLPEVLKIYPLVRVDRGYLVGQPVLAGTAPSAGNVVTEDFGDQIRVSWDWPSGDYLMELKWTDNGRSRTRRVTRTKYRAEGGIMLTNAVGIAELSISTVVRVDDEEWTSARIPVQLAKTDKRQRVSYRMDLTKSLFGGKVTCKITASTETPGFVMPVDVVLKQGPIMPFRVQDGQRITQLELDFSAETERTYTLQLGKQKSPFWVCLFTEDPELLVPPSSSELKG
ncbi:fibronectin type III domain-containing protein [Glutamicibacter sp. NPDC087344]|uniref:fibronectin type III domain-containing protein n=1 Tax=Glutamicibacter sp. NPDC087344 TaxID=3363994 RepID=UPI003823E61F